MFRPVISGFSSPFNWQALCTSIMVPRMVWNSNWQRKSTSSELQISTGILKAKLKQSKELTWERIGAWVEKDFGPKAVWPLISNAQLEVGGPTHFCPGIYLDLPNKNLFKIPHWGCRDRLRVFRDFLRGLGTQNSHNRCPRSGFVKFIVLK
jgi:hypothetical protein